MSAVQITCINKTDRPNPHEAIESIGWKNPDGNRWKCSQKQAIEWIESKKYSFYVQVGQNKVDVIVSTSPYGNKYIKTTADNTWKDNLLSLTECPI